jgi:hypothetical protein
MPTGRHNVCFATGRKKGLLAIRQAPETLGTCPRARRVCRCTHKHSRVTVRPQPTVYQAGERTTIETRARSVN